MKVIFSVIFTSRVLFCWLFWQLDQSDQAPNWHFSRNSIVVISQQNKVTFLFLLVFLVDFAFFKQLFLLRAASNSLFFDQLQWSVLDSVLLENNSSRQCLPRSYKHPPQIVLQLYQLPKKEWRYFLFRKFLKRFQFSAYLALAPGHWFRLLKDTNGWKKERAFTVVLWCSDAGMYYVCKKKKNRSDWTYFLLCFCEACPYNFWWFFSFFHMMGLSF